MIALAADDHFLAGLCAQYLEVFVRYSLKPILGNGNVEKKRGRGGDVVAEMTFDRKLHTLFAPSNLTDFHRRRPTSRSRNAAFQGEASQVSF